MHRLTKYNQQLIQNNPIRPILFDVSLRDGIQAAPLSEFSTANKLKNLHRIWNTHKPIKMELGSYVSPSKMPIMGDTWAIQEYVKRQHAKNKLPILDYYLIPNMAGFIAATSKGATNLSFITSVSDTFQLANTNRTLTDNRIGLMHMMSVIQTQEHETGANFNTKLYISCVSECPLEGKMDLQHIVREIYSYYSDFPRKFDEYCLSDTMGTLTHKDFAQIVNELLGLGMTPEQLSVHLHINMDNVGESKNILFECFKLGIRRFDVSDIKYGGCSATMDSGRLKPNMTYDFFYATLDDYLQDDERHYNGL